MRLVENPETSNFMPRLFVAALLLAVVPACGMRSTLTEDQTGHPLKVDVDAEDEKTECGAGVMPCKLDDLNGATCETLGFEGGELFCDPRTCLYDTTDCDDGGGSGDGDGGDGDAGGDGDMGGMGGMGGGQGGTSGGDQGGGFFGGGNGFGGGANPQ